MTEPSLFRGICVDNVDPQGLGRVRVQVPQVLGPSASGWAFPAWAFHDLTIWPEDRIPKPGQGVWIQFEHPDRMTWLAAFGEQEFSNQRFDNLLDPDTGLPIAYETSMAWDLPVLPELIEVPIVGTLLSLSGIPQPNPTVYLEKSADNRATWIPALPEPENAALVDPDGSWSFEYTRQPTETGYWYRATYPGSNPFWPASTPEEQIPDPPNDTQILIEPVVPAWQRTSTFIGTLTTLLGEPVKYARVRLYQRLATGGPWSEYANATTDHLGQWRIDWFWKKEWVEAMELKAVFLGDDIYDFSQTVPLQLAKVSVPVQVTWNFPVEVAYNQTYPLTGVCTTANYGTPDPATVQLQYRTPSGSANPWQVRATLPIAANGAWNGSVQFSVPDADYRAYYPAAGVYQEGSTPIETRVISLTTTVSAPTVPAANHGSTIAVTGSVRDESGALVTGGTAQLDYRQAGDTAWTRSASAGTVNVAVNGTFALTHLVLFVGSVEWRVQYLGGGAGFYLPSISPTTVTSVGMGTVGTPNKDSISHTGAQISWAAVSGTQTYQTYKDNAWLEDSTSSTDRVTGLGLSNDQDFTLKVRAGRQAKNGTWVWGAFSASVSGNTGHPEVRKIGGPVGYEARPTITGTYRPVEGNYSYNGENVVQGYYSNSTYTGYGVMTYNGAVFRQWVADRWGWDTVSNLTFSVTKVAMYRSSGSGSGDDSLWWYVTPATAHSGGQPVLAGGEAGGSLSPGGSAWITLASAHWGKHVLMNEWIKDIGTINSFCLHRHNSSEYAKFLGPGGASNACNIYVEFSWNFVTVALKAAKWN